MTDYLEIFSQLNANKIKYIIVGGLAINIHGIPRATYDIDLLLDMNKENLEKFILLMKKLGFKPKVPVEIEDFLSEEKRKRWIEEKNMKAFSLYNPKFTITEIDVVINTSISYKDAIKNVVHKKICDILLPVISIKDIIKMKTSSSRKQDIADIEMLKKLL